MSTSHGCHTHQLCPYICVGCLLMSLGTHGAAGGFITTPAGLGSYLYMPNLYLICFFQTPQLGSMSAVGKCKLTTMQ